MRAWAEGLQNRYLANQASRPVIPLKLRAAFAAASLAVAVAVYFFVGRIVAIGLMTVLVALTPVVSIGFERWRERRRQ